MTLKLVEIKQINGKSVELYCYPLNGWALFIRTPGVIEPKIINGKLNDVLPKYRELLNGTA